MKNGGKAVATLAVWAGIVALSYMFNSFGILDGAGAFGLVGAGLLGTGIIWNS
ncbi:MAG: hypothetical protein UW30_C0006G0001 [Candidatus Giovannonibacteria bacterium GW2011_GWA2_44_13b]|uniref:Uncharacterized protein n=1 Tax=Candidatus Giovannonibacteria bacterium GW2011_GWA2_44_13b TaxID=1618647 RepID=A0A0G1K1A5_9BACT|nr:MAG: hypothetical protein UW30_C0006G0001 [Candidatus Giovannonibacteria bacterium GW2011_GWA2_44_13b]